MVCVWEAQAFRESKKEEEEVERQGFVFFFF